MLAFRILIKAADKFAGRLSNVFFEHLIEIFVVLEADRLRDFINLQTILPQ